MESLQRKLTVRKKIRDNGKGKGDTARGEETFKHGQNSEREEIQNWDF